MSNRSIEVNYHNGAPALRIQPDQSGQAFYNPDDVNGGQAIVSGSVAVRVNSTAAGTRQHFFYDPAHESESLRQSNGKFTRSSRPKTFTGKTLAIFNEHTIGSASEHHGSSQRRVLSLTARGGQLSDQSQHKILCSWFWDKRKQNAGDPPQAVSFELNKYLKLRFVDGCHVFVDFTSGEISHTFDCGVVTQSKLRAAGVNPRKQQVERITLIDRNKQFHDSMLLKKLALHPTSDRFTTAGFKDIVADLENDLESWRQKAECKSLGSSGLYDALGNTQQSAVSQHKTRALEQTQSELPYLTLRDNYSSISPHATMISEPTQLSGLAEKTDSPLASSTSETRGAAWHGGRWLNVYDVRRKLEGVHPELARSAALQRNSGRTVYTGGLLANASPSLRDFLCAHRKLQRIDPLDVERFVKHDVADDKLICVAFIREDEPQCRRAMQLLEHVNATFSLMYPFSEQYEHHTSVLSESDREILQQMSIAARQVPGRQTSEHQYTTSPCTIILADMAKNKHAGRLLKIWSLPYYTMYYDGKPVYSGVLGGPSEVRLPICNRAINILALEPQAKHQIITEKACKSARLPVTIAAGKFDPKVGGAVAVAAEAMKRIEDLLARTKKNSRRISDRHRSKSTSSGSSASITPTGEFSLVLIDGDPSVACSKAEIRSLVSALGHAADRVGRKCRSPLLAGHSLVVHVLPAGTAYPGQSSWTANTNSTLFQSSGVDTGGLEFESLNAGEHGGKSTPHGRGAATSVLRQHARTVLASNEASLSTTLSSSLKYRASPHEFTPSPPSDTPWACPRTNIIQNPTKDMLADGMAAVAVVRPIKRATLKALGQLWITIMRYNNPTGGVLGGLGATLPGQDLGTTGDGDGVHLGTTHNDLIARIFEGLQKGKAGMFLSQSEQQRRGLVLSNAEIRVRGVPLCT